MEKQDQNINTLSNPRTFEGEKNFNELSENKSKGVVSLLDYGAGNVRSVRNAIFALGYEVHDITTVQEIEEAEMIIFPGK